MRQAMRTGDDRFLPARDKGPVRRFIRDYVDSRFSLLELMIPLMLVVLILGYSGNPTLTTYANLAMLPCSSWSSSTCSGCGSGCARELTARFPDESQKGTTYYAVMRSLQMRFMRLPKAQVKVGAAAPRALPVERGRSESTRSERTAAASLLARPRSSVVVEDDARRRRVRLAGEDVAVRDLLGLEGVVDVHRHRALDQLGAAGAAHAAAAGERQVGAHLQRGLEDAHVVGAQLEVGATGRRA